MLITVIVHLKSSVICLSKLMGKITLSLCTVHSLPKLKGEYLILFSSLVRRYEKLILLHGLIKCWHLGEISKLLFN